MVVSARAPVDSNSEERVIRICGMDTETVVISSNTNTNAKKSVLNVHWTLAFLRSNPLSTGPLNIDTRCGSLGTACCMITPPNGYPPWNVLSRLGRRGSRWMSIPQQKTSSCALIACNQPHRTWVFSLNVPGREAGRARSAKTPSPGRLVTANSAMAGRAVPAVHRFGPAAKP